MPERADSLQCWKISLSDPILYIVEINGKSCHLKALVDTGSPVSFIKSSVFHKPNNLNERFEGRFPRRYNTLSNHTINVLETVKSGIRLNLRPDLLLDIELNIHGSDNFEHDVVLGRDFLVNKLTLSFALELNKLENDLRHELPFADVYAVSSDSLLKDCDVDFGLESKNRLVKLVKEIEDASIPVIEDDYRVRVNLVDKSVYAFAPRKFAFEERKQIREIIDDLLSREIIKPSISPYCARVVPVRKKDGRIRLCVDLRPLNDRVAKQKYPFPMIEDCIARLGDSRVFTLLDLRDRFHQIKVHPSDTHYFAFSTPDGQYEYTRLPFGFCEAPAEFSKRLVQILQSLIREDKVLVYMDDILIPTKLLEENFVVLKQVFLTLRKYGFELNYRKCQFLRERIEYLGYMVSSKGITLSSRHTEAIKNY